MRPTLNENVQNAEKEAALFRQPLFQFFPAKLFKLIYKRSCEANLI